MNTTYNLPQLDEELRTALTLALRLGLSYDGVTLTIHWSNQNISPTPQQLATANATIAAHVPDPDWIDPLSPDYEWLVWKRDQLTGSPPPSHVELWYMFKVILERMA